MDYRMPLYIQIQDIIIKKIEGGKYLPGQAIPSERKMAETYNVNRMTVKRAVTKLVELGYLYRKPGAGTYVTKRDNKKIDLSYANKDSNSGMTATIKGAGMEISNKIFGIGETSESNYLNYKLNLSPGENVQGLHRIRYSNNIPFAVEYTYMPKKFFEDFNDFDFTKVSLYDYMDKKNHMPVYFTQNLLVCEASEKIASLLNVERGTAIFKIEYQGADRDRNFVEYTKSYLNPSMAVFSFKSRVK